MLKFLDMFNLYLLESVFRNPPCSFSVHVHFYLYQSTIIDSSLYYIIYAPKMVVIEVSHNVFNVLISYYNVMNFVVLPPETTIV